MVVLIAEQSILNSDEDKVGQFPLWRSNKENR